MPGAATPVTPRGALRRFLRTRVLAHRRAWAALLVALAVASGLRALAPPAPPIETVLVAAHDLPAGTVLTGSDLTRVPWPAGAAPDGLAARPVGRTVAAPLRRGEPLTDVRLVAPSLLAGYPGLVALPVRIPDPAAVSLLRVGDEIDLVASDPEAATATTVAVGAPVLALPPEPVDGSAQASGGRLVVLGLDAAEVREVSVAAARQFLTVAFSR